MLNRTSSDEFKPLVEYHYSNDKVIIKDKFWPPSEITPLEFNDHFNTIKRHGIFYKKEDENLVRKLIQKKKVDNLSDTHLVRNYLNNPKSYFRIEYINPSIGYGLVALGDIPKNTVVGIYSGELMLIPAGKDEKIPQEDRVYDMNVFNEVNISGKYYSVIIRAKNGDYTRFAHHAFNQSELKDISVHPALNKKNICTANMEFPLAVIDGKPIRYFITTEAIKMGEFATISYGMGYWKNRGWPSLFIKEVNGLRIANYSVENHQYRLSDDLIEPPTDLEKKLPEIHLKQDKKCNIPNITLSHAPLPNKNLNPNTLGFFAKPIQKKKAKPHFLKPLNHVR